MAEFRRIVLVLAVLALCAGLASAQMTCTSNTTPTQIRSEGVTELMGDILLQCTGGVGTPAGVGVGGSVAIPQVNFVVYTNTPVTSRLLSASTGTASEATLLIDDPGSGETIPGSGGVVTYGASLPVIPCTTPLTGCVAYADGITYNSGPDTVPVSTVGGTVPTNAAPNEYFGIVSGSSVTFNGVPVLAPSSSNFTRYYRFTNIRVNASAITGGTLPGSIIAEVATSSSTNITVPQSALTTGYVGQSLKTSVRNSSDGSTLSQNILQCNTNNGVSTSTTTPVTFEVLRFSEVFAQAFKTRLAPLAGSTTSSTSLQNVPGYSYISESGFVPYSNGNVQGPAGPIGNTSVPQPGLADYGTRLKAVFSNIPAGVNIYVQSQTSLGGSGTAGAPNINLGSSTTAVTLIPSATYLYGGGTLVGLTPTTTTETQATTSIANYNAVQLAVSGGSATAVWEVVNTNTSAIENVDIPVAIQYTAAPSTNSPAIGVMTVNLEYGPTAADIGGTITAASSSQPIPRFIDTSGTNSNTNTFLTVVQCTTSLLFTFVSNVTTVGDDTGIAIANTTTDTFSTPAQAGTCTLNWYGTAAPAPTVTPSVASGTVWTGLTSLLAPGFSGYVIANCNFQYAHGLAFISDLGLRNWAMGYLALVMNQPSTSYRPIPTGEVLAH